MSDTIIKYIKFYLYCIFIGAQDESRQQSLPTSLAEWNPSSKFGYFRLHVIFFFKVRNNFIYK